MGVAEENEWQAALRRLANRYARRYTERIIGPDFSQANPGIGQGDLQDPAGEGAPPHPVGAIMNINKLSHQ